MEACRRATLSHLPHGRAFKTAVLWCFHEGRRISRRDEGRATQCRAAAKQTSGIIVHECGRKAFGRWAAILTPPLLHMEPCLNALTRPAPAMVDRQSDVEGKGGSVRVDLGGRRNLKKKTKYKQS